MSATATAVATAPAFVAGDVLRHRGTGDLWDVESTLHYPGGQDPALHRLRRRGDGERRTVTAEAAASMFQLVDSRALDAAEPEPADDPEAASQRWVVEHMAEDRDVALAASHVHCASGTISQRQTADLACAERGYWPSNAATVQGMAAAVARQLRAGHFATVARNARAGLLLAWGRSV